MSKALSRVRALVSEIDLIQSEGRKSPSSVPLMRAVQTEQPVSAQNEQEKLINVLPLNPPPVATLAAAAAAEGKVFIQLTGKIAVQLQLEHTDEVVEVRQQGETIEIRFTDGKAIHLPLKSVA